MDEPSFAACALDEYRSQSFMGEAIVVGTGLNVLASPDGLTFRVYRYHS